MKIIDISDIPMNRSKRVTQDQVLELLKSHTLAEIGAMFGVSRQRIQQISGNCSGIRAESRKAAARAAFAKVADLFNRTELRQADIEAAAGISFGTMRRYGVEIPERSKPVKYPTNRETVMQNITITDRGCWEWNAAREKSGYGRCSKPGKYAHRMAWLAFRGEIPSGMWVLHSCDNPPCCNPDHLWLGTPADNVHDSMRKGRRPTAL